MLVIQIPTVANFLKGYEIYGNNIQDEILSVNTLIFILHTSELGSKNSSP